MKLLLSSLIFVSVAVSAQKTPVIPKVTEPLKIINSDNLLKAGKTEDNTKQDELKKYYKMPVSKPKNVNLYSCLKSKKADTTKYAVLNALTPEKPKMEAKK